MAGKVSHTAIEEIRANTDIVAVINSYINLKHSGSTFKALCPFHKEKTPSFIVNPQKQFYHCFGCGAGGDVFRFIMEYEKVDFLTAIRMLAQRAGIPLAFDQQEDADKPRKDALYALNDQAAHFYHNFLQKSPDAKRALAYLQSRHFSSVSIMDFLIGYAPPKWDTILAWAATKYKMQELEAAGLVINPSKDSEALGTNAEKKTLGHKRAYDRFRDRLMFPICDEQGRILGFSGRILPDRERKDIAKYINTPETVLFHKSRILYALNKARRAIVEAREAIICEGQIDVIRCHSAGFANAVGAQGTAFTLDHARILKRYADNVIIVFDADCPGQDAALRAAGVFMEVGLAIRIVSLPIGKDPDLVLQGEDGSKIFRDLLKNAKPAIKFQIDILNERENLQTETGLLRATSAALELIQRTPNAVQQSLLLEQAAERLGVPLVALQKEFHKKAPRIRSLETLQEQKRKTQPEHPPKEEALAEHLVREPALSGLVKKYLPLSLITDSICKKLIQAVIQSIEIGKDLIDVVSENDDEERQLSQLAARIMATPSKIKGGLTTSTEAVKSLILGICTADLQRRRKEIEQLRFAFRAGKQQKLPASRQKELEREYTQLSYDIAKLKNWSTAIPIIEFL